MAKKSRPGILFYFEMVEPLLTQLTDEQAGQLFRAAFEYGQYGVVPSFPTGNMLAMAWALLKPAIDRDGERYNDTVAQRAFAVYVRECKRNGRQPVSFEEFKINGGHQPTSTDNDRHRPITDDNGRYPNTNTTTKATPTTNTKANPNTNTKCDLPYMQQMADEDERSLTFLGKSVMDNDYVAELENGDEYENDELPF